MSAPRRPGTPTRVRAFAPASISNVGPGFDVFGVALRRPGDEVVARRVPGRGVRSVVVTGDGGRVPRDPARNAAALAVQGVLDRLDASVGVEIEVRKGIPYASGLGGSAASAVAGGVAANALLGGRLDPSALLEAAMVGERKGSGANHADNAAPSLVGGFVLVLPGEPPRMVRVATPSGTTLAVVHPHMEVETRRARDMLGSRVALADAIAQWGNAAGVVAALWQEDWDLLGRCLADRVAEPVRAALVPGFPAVRRAALDAGAAGAGLSGSGPSVFALCRSRASAMAAAAAMATAFRREADLESDSIVSDVAPSGAKVLEAE